MFVFRTCRENRLAPDFGCINAVPRDGKTVLGRGAERPDLLVAAFTFHCNVKLGKTEKRTMDSALFLYELSRINAGRGLQSTPWINTLRVLVLV